MANKIYANYPPPLSSEQETFLIQTVKDWTIEHGLAVRPSTAIVPEETNPGKVLATNAPVTLFPSPFPKSCLDQARSLQQTYNELYAAIANDEDWLETIMKEYVLTRSSSDVLRLRVYNSFPTGAKWYRSFC
jgi:glutathione synthase